MELALVVVQVLQRHPRLAGLPVDDGGEPLDERAAPACPARSSRTVRPSISSEPRARISPVAQSIGPWVIAAARRCSCGITLGCTVKPSGKVVCASAIFFSVSMVIAVPCLAAALLGYAGTRL